MNTDDRLRHEPCNDGQKDVWGDQLRAHLDAAERLGELLPTAERVSTVICAAFTAGNRLWTFGNGGSAADAQHLTGELVGHYRRDRRPLPAVTLSTDPTVMTCIANDYDYCAVFARQVEALVVPGDVVCAFTTSGRSANIVAGLRTASARGAVTVLFGGGDGGPARDHAHHALLAPSSDTPRIQEMHTLMLHMISEAVDAWAAGETSDGPNGVGAVGLGERVPGVSA